jgi:hypothetical protein
MTAGGRAVRGFQKVAGGNSTRSRKTNSRDETLTEVCKCSGCWAMLSKRASQVPTGGARGRVGGLIARQRGDEEAAVWVVSHDAFGCQELECLAYGHAARVDLSARSVWCSWRPGARMPRVTSGRSSRYRAQTSAQVHRSDNIVHSRRIKLNVLCARLRQRLGEGHVAARESLIVLDGEQHMRRPACSSERP